MGHKQNAYNNYLFYDYKLISSFASYDFGGFYQVLVCNCSGCACKREQRVKLHTSSVRTSDSTSFVEHLAVRKENNY